MQKVRVRDVWWAFVVAGFREKYGAALLALGVGSSCWLFATGRTTGGAALLAAFACIYLRVAAAIGALLGARAERRNR